MVRYELLLHKEPKAIYLLNAVMSYFLAKKRWPIDPLSHLLSNILDKPILVLAARHSKHPKDSKTQYIQDTYLDK